MIRDYFRVLVVDLVSGKGKMANVPGRDEVAGGSGLGALLFTKYGRVDQPWDDPEQPVIFAIGPLTGYFPLMSKTVAAFKSPYHDQGPHSHAGALRPGPGLPTWTPWCSPAKRPAPRPWWWVPATWN